MRKIPAIFCLLIAVGISTPAQSSQPPTIEVFGGYSHLSSNNRHGWHASVAANLTPWLGIVTDFDGHYKTENSRLGVGNLESKTRLHSFLFGPRLSLRRHQTVTPFVHVLAGATRSKTRLRLSGAASGFADFPLPELAVSSQRSDFAVAVGGGVDVRLNDRAALRLLQIDYLRTNFYRSSGRGNIEADAMLVPRNSARISTGLVLRF